MFDFIQKSKSFLRFSRINALHSPKLPCQNLKQESILSKYATNCSYHVKTQKIFSWKYRIFLIFTRKVKRNEKRRRASDQPYSWISKPHSVHLGSFSFDFMRVSSNDFKISSTNFNIFYWKVKAVDASHAILSWSYKVWSIPKSEV